MPALATAAALAVLVYLLDPRRLVEAVRSADPRWLAGAALAHALSLLVSAARFRALVAEPGPSVPLVPRLWGTELISSGACYFLPPGAGEIARAGVWKSCAGVPAVRMGVAILVARALDFCVLASAVAGLWVFRVLPEHPSVAGVSTAMAIVAAVLALLLVGVAWRGKPFYLVLARRMAGLLSWFRPRWGPRFERWAAAGVSSGPPHPRPIARDLALVALTVLYWTGNFALFLCLARAVLPDIGWGEVAAIFAFAFALALVPARPFADLGTHELGWALPLAFHGRSQEEAVAFAAATHLLVAGIMLAIVPVGALVTRLGRRPL